MWKRALALALTALVLYGVFPAVMEVLGGWDDLDDIAPGWWLVLLGTQVLGWASMWGLQRLALHTKLWLPVATSQLASGAIGRVVPGGAAAAAALQYKMLAQAGLPSAAVGTGLTAGSLLLLAALAALPLLALPAIITGRTIPDTLLACGALALVLFAALTAIGLLLMTSTRAIRWVGRAISNVLKTFKRPRPEDLPGTLVRERDVIKGTLGRRWPEALVFAVGRWLLDFLTLLAALQAVGARPTVTLALLAYCAAQLLAQFPITPGGLGVVEAGLTGTLALAGVPAAAAAVATLAYRLASYWLPLPVGAGAYALHRSKYGDVPATVEPSPAQPWGVELAHSSGTRNGPDDPHAQADDDQ